MSQATLVRTLSGWRGDARLYRVEPQVEYRTYNWHPTYDGDGGEYRREDHTTGYVIVSAAEVPFSGPETYIFPATEGGDVIDWGELPGSYQGGLDHAEALRGAGYEAD